MILNFTTESSVNGETEIMKFSLAFVNTNFHWEKLSSFTSHVFDVELGLCQQECFQHLGLPASSVEVTPIGEITANYCLQTWHTCRCSESRLIQSIIGFCSLVEKLSLVLYWQRTSTVKFGRSSHSKLRLNRLYPDMF